MVKFVRAYSYVRWSTAEQSDGDSLRRQTEAAERYCERNKLTLDTEFTLRDMGISAYSGKNIDQGKFGVFLDAVRSGRVPKGSVLLVEALDRISRAEIEKSDAPIRELLKAGIDIVLLRTERRFNRKSLSDPNALSEINWTLHLANLESKQKSERVGAAWRQKRKAAVQSRTIQSRTTYAWLRVTDDRKTFSVKENEAKLVRRMFAMAADGQSILDICRALNKEGIANFGRDGGTWTTGYITKILSSRAVIGEFQPRTRKAGKWETDGEPVKDYYPRIIDDETFYRVQSGKAKRNKIGGRHSQHVSNLFAGLCYSTDGSPFVVTGKYPEGWMVSELARQGKSPYLSFPYGHFERAFLALIRKVKPSDLLPAEKQTDGGNEASDLAGQLAALESRSQAIASRLAAPKQDDDTEILMDTLAAIKRKRAALSKKLEQVRAQRASLPTERLGDVGGLLPLLDTCPADELPGLRAKIKSRLQAVIKRITCKITKDGEVRAITAKVQIDGGITLPLQVKARGYRLPVQDGAIAVAQSANLRMADFTGKHLGWQLVDVSA